MQHHWTEKYLGKKFRPLSSGPDFYDCYSLSQAIVNDRCGVILPNQSDMQSSKPECVDSAWREERKREGWRQLNRAEQYATVFMAKSDGMFSHVGTVVGVRNPLILHIGKNIDSTLQEIIKLKYLFGFRIFEYWKYGDTY